MPAASSLSASLVIEGRSIVNILPPASWDSASLTFDVSACAGGTFYPLYGDNNAEVVIQFTACTAIGNHSKLEKLAGWYGMRIWSGSAVGDPDDQTVARTFIISQSG
jgi:hypothetical protein